MRGAHTLVAQQGIQLRLTTTEGFERFHRGSAAADFQNRFAVAAAGVDAGCAVLGGGFFKGGVGIGAQHLGPLVAVVTGGIATRKDVAEGVQCAASSRAL